MQELSDSTNILQQNFSKIGKYISNKLPHTRHSKPEGKSPTIKTIHHNRIEPKKEEREKIQERASCKVKIGQPKHAEKENCIASQWESSEPSVGSYRINYSGIQKNTRFCDFTKSTPHFFLQKQVFQEITSVIKEYPDGPTEKLKGFKELGRMPGREQIKGNIRKLMENPHQNRFVCKPTTLNPSRVDFAKMSPRKDYTIKLNETLASTKVNFQLGMPRLDTHILQFGKQKQRTNLDFLPALGTSDTFRYERDYDPLQNDRSVGWNKILPRDSPSLLPSYMNNTNHSRTMVETRNEKCLLMNCYEMKKVVRKTQKKPKGKTRLYKQVFEVDK